jgi:hypothetical protein
MMYRSEVAPLGAFGVCNTAARIVGTAEIATGFSSSTVCQNCDAEKRSHLPGPQVAHAVDGGCTQSTTPMVSRRAMAGEPGLTYASSIVTESDAR